MSLNTLVAVLVGFGLFFAAIALSRDNYLVFVSGATIILVLGGILASTFISYEFQYVLYGLRGIIGAFKMDRRGRTRLNTEVGRVIRWAYLVQKEGIVSLDAEAKKTPRHIQDHMNSYLDPTIWCDIDRQLKGCAAMSSGKSAEKAKPTSAAA